MSSNRLLGYTRIPAHAHEAEDLAALLDAGCERVFVDRSRRFDQRRELAELLLEARPGDTVVVTRLASIGRDLSFLVETLNHLAGHGLKFRSLDDGIQTGRAATRMDLFTFTQACAKFVADLDAEARRNRLPLVRSGGY